MRTKDEMERMRTCLDKQYMYIKAAWLHLYTCKCMHMHMCVYYVCVWAGCMYMYECVGGPYATHMLRA